MIQLIDHLSCTEQRGERAGGSEAVITIIRSGKSYLFDYDADREVAVILLPVGKRIIEIFVTSTMLVRMGLDAGSILKIGQR